jgi:hypothetical protein
VGAHSKAPALTKADRETCGRREAFGSAPLHFNGKRGQLDARAAMSIGPGGAGRAQTLAGRRAGKTASATNEESIRMLKQRGEYESLRAAVEKSRYGLREQKSTGVSGSASGYIASNHAQNFRADFTKTGVYVEPRSADQPDWRWGLSLTGYGYGGALQPLTKTEMSSAGNRVEYRYFVAPRSRGKEKMYSTPPLEGAGEMRAALTEWYVNDARGIEHGFTLSSPPAGAREENTPAAITADGTLARSGSARRQPHTPDGEFLHLALEVSGNLQGRMVEGSLQ